MSLRDLASLAIDASVVAGRIGLGIGWLAGAAVLAYALPLVASLVAIAALFLCLTWQSWRLGLLGRRYALRQLQCDQDGQWWLLTAEGSRQAATLLENSRVGTHLVWLGWQGERGRYWTLLLRRQVSAASWRRLQARLRLLPRLMPRRAGAEPVV